MNILRYFGGPVMAGKTKLMSDFINLFKPSEYFLLAPKIININNAENFTIKSRVEGYEPLTPYAIEKDTDLYNLIMNQDTSNIRAIFCDEIQFFEKCHIDQLKRISLKTNIQVFLFGINTDHKKNIWPTIKYLEDHCIAQYLTIKCSYCTKLAPFCIRYDANSDADSVDPGNDDNGEKYFPCCGDCWDLRTGKNKF